MPNDRPQLPCETHQAMLARGAAYCPLMYGEVSEFPRKARWGRMLLEAATVGLAVVTVCVLVVGFGR